MAESTLSLGLPDFRSAVARLLGLDRTFANNSANNQTDIDEVIHAGYRQFLFPPEVNLDNRPYRHTWSFLYPTTTLALVGADFDYDLPDNFGGIMGSFTYPQNDGYGPVFIVDENQIRDIRQYGNETGRPRVAAIRPKSSTGSTGQRFEAIFYPTPDSSRTLTYRYQVQIDKLTPSFPYPLGGMAHAETIMESCLALAESREDDEVTLHNGLFRDRLMASIQQDLKMQPRYLGYNSDRSEADWRYNLPVQRQVLVNGTTP